MADLFMPGLLRGLFNFDEPFGRIGKAGLDETTRAALSSFWERPGLEALAWRPLDVDALGNDLMALATGNRRVAAAPELLALASVASEELAREHPLAASFVALYVVAIWTGQLGEHLFKQPWEGSHPGWYRHPLALARNLVAAGGFWTARAVATTAADFIESEKSAPFSADLQAILLAYRDVLARVEARIGECVAELAFAVRAACQPPGDNARAGLAALFWSLGDVHHAGLVAGGALPRPSVVRGLVATSIARLESDPLQQYVWLEMKDRPPLDLRAHAVLFSRLNARYHGHPLHGLDDMASMVGSPISRAYARVAISYFRGGVDRDALGELGMQHGTFGDRLQKVVQMGSSFVRVTGMLNLATPGPAVEVAGRWRDLADFAAWGQGYASRYGYIDEAADPSWAIPFAYLPLDTAEAIAATLGAVERHRAANLWYWLARTTPPAPGEPAAEPLLQEERDLLSELRGARFIRLLPSLPQHYRRYGFNMQDALERPPPEGATEVAGADRRLLKYDPFDPELALRELRTAYDGLRALHERFAAVAPAYAAQRLDPGVAHDAFLRAVRPPAA